MVFFGGKVTTPSAKAPVLYGRKATFVKKLNYARWFMDLLSENSAMAKRFKPFKEERVDLFGQIKLVRFWYNVEAK